MQWSGGSGGGDYGSGGQGGDQQQYGGQGSTDNY
jgi:hypothetical protein